MGVLDRLCRFCSQEIDPSMGQNVFDSTSYQILQTASLCLPETLSADDRYPKLACIHCIFKINVVTEFRNAGLSACKVFDDILSKENSLPSEKAQNQLNEMKVEVLSDLELEATTGRALKMEYHSQAQITGQNEITDQQRSNEGQAQNQFADMKEELLSDLELEESESESEGRNTPPQLRVAVKAIVKNKIKKLPDKSIERYEARYNDFKNWVLQNHVTNYTENVMMTYFSELSKNKKFKPSTLWSIYSMLKTTIQNNDYVDISKHNKLRHFLKKINGFSKPKTSKVLLAEEILRFLEEAPDILYLHLKVILIFGIFGGLRRREMHQLTLNDVEEKFDLLLVTVAQSEKKRTFTITGKFYEIYKKYRLIRMEKAETDKLFLNYNKGKCTKQPMGLNKIATVPMKIATFLNLSTPKEYTGHCFRRSAAMLQAMQWLG